MAAVFVTTDISARPSQSFLIPLSTLTGFVLFGHFVYASATDLCWTLLTHYWPLTLNRSRKLWDNNAPFHPHTVSGKTRGNLSKEKKVKDEKRPKSARSQNVWVSDGGCPRAWRGIKTKAPAGLWRRGQEAGSRGVPGGVQQRLSALSKCLRPRVKLPFPLGPGKTFPTLVHASSAAKTTTRIPPEKPRGKNHETEVWTKAEVLPVTSLLYLNRLHRKELPTEH